MPREPKRKGVKRLSVALQGGGSHGAFTWGVMHRLMSDTRIYIDGISGTSAGAINGVVFADGFIKGQRQGAINALEELWHKVSRSGLLMPVDPNTAFIMMDLVTRLLSPYELNPFNLNPLRDILREMVDFEGLRAHPFIKLFVTASNVRTCKPRVFRTHELKVEALMASACLPLIFQAVEVDGEHYWDGGYLGNPAIYPLIHECSSNDVVIVQINPMNRPDVPTTSREILNRINEMSFNSSLVREMRGIATVSRLVEQGALQKTGYEAVRFHQIDAEEEMGRLGALSKFNTEFSFLKKLHDLGYETADKWLAQNFDRIGVENTLDVFEKFI
jgi:NTE family protein